MKTVLRKEIASVFMIKMILLKSAVSVAFVGRGKFKISHENIDVIVNNLKHTIRKLDQSFNDVKKQMLELAIALDASQRYDRRHISKKIKHLLEDDFKKRKTTKVECYSGLYSNKLRFGFQVLCLCRYHNEESVIT
jgi:hypothetical protein